MEKQRTEQESELITTEFFKRRFPDKELAFEKSCGYFGEWVKRFIGSSVVSYMDSESLSVWEQMKSEGFK